MIRVMLGAGAMMAAAIWSQAALADPKVLSIGGSVTEIVVALGAEDRLIGRDSTSNYPASVQALPDVGYIRALSPEGVLALAPDLIVSEAGAGPAEALDVLRGAGVRFVETADDPTPEGILAKIATVADALALPQAGAELQAKVRADLDHVRARAEAVEARKRVLFILTLTDGRVMVGGAGTSADGLIQLAGGINAAADLQGYKEMSAESLLAASPDLILAMERAGPMAVTAQALAAHPSLALSPAVQKGALLQFDGLLMLGFGPRTAEAADLVHDALYAR